MNLTITKGLSTVRRGPVASDVEPLFRQGFMRGKDPWLAEAAPVLAREIASLRERKKPPVFVFLYDDPWVAFYRQAASLAAMLGPGFCALPDFWAWCVNPKENGWRPHRDRGAYAVTRTEAEPAGKPMAITLWIPLTTADRETSCIRVLPHEKDPLYDQDPIAVAGDDGVFLETEPGEWLAWNQAIAHMGSTALAHHRAPRMSISLEFRRADVQDKIRSGLSHMVIPCLEDRARLIELQVDSYAHMTSMSAEEIEETYLALDDEVERVSALPGSGERVGMLAGEP